MTKHTIMFLAANPNGTDHLALDREARSIHVELERSSRGDHFEFVTRFAAEPLDLIRELRKLRPTVVQFSGHGGRAADARQRPAPHRDVVHGLCPDDADHCAGLYFQGADGAARVVTGTALRDAFAAAGSSVKLVVLNACYSELAAEALLAHVDCVVGMSGSIGDDAARAFARRLLRRALSGDEACERLITRVPRILWGALGALVLLTAIGGGLWWRKCARARVV